MKRIFGFLPLVATLFLFSCKEAELPMEDAAVEVNPARIETDWQQAITEVEVTANCTWTLSRSDAQGNEIDWVKVDKLSAKGSSKVGLKILQNQYQESRAAVITFEAGNAKAYLDIVQEANPNKPEPEPDPEPEPEPEPVSGYTFPMYQRFTTGQSIDIESGKVVRYPFDQMPIEEATVEGSKITFSKGLVIEASTGSYSVARPAHTNPTKYAGFQEGFCLEGFETGTITYTIPFSEAVSGKVRFFKGQRRETGDNYSWSTDGGVTFHEVGAAKAGASDAFWKYLDFEIPASEAVQAGGSLIIKETVTFNSSSTYGGIMMQCGVSLQSAEGEMSSLESGSNVVFAEGFDNIIDAPAAQLLDYGFMKSWTSGKYTAPSYTTASVPSIPAIVTPSVCYSRPGFLQIGYADEAMAFAAKEYYIPGSYKVNVGERLKEMGISNCDLTITFKAAGLTTAFEEQGNAEPIVSATKGSVSDNGIVSLTPDTWKDFSFTVSGADQTTVIEIASNSTNAGARAGKPDNRFFIDDIVIKAAEAAAPSEPIVLNFDFCIEGLSWPTGKTSWSGLKNLDSGLAIDGNEDAENTHRRATVTYPLGGKEYDFVIADPDGATAHNIYLSTGKGIYVGTLRYVGLPAIEGMRLSEVVMVQNASTKDPETFKRNVGISSNIVGVDDAGISYISGGEVQNQYTNLGEYTYTLDLTAANTIYYIHSPSNASIVKSLKLTYIPAK